MVEDVAEKYLRKLKKVMSVWPDFFSNFQWIHWSEMTVLYLYLVVWGVTDWAFSISGSNCSHTVVLCHFPCFFAQLSPPSNICLNICYKFSLISWSYGRKWNTHNNIFKTLVRGKVIPFWQAGPYKSLKQALFNGVGSTICSLPGFWENCPQRWNFNTS